MNSFFNKITTLLDSSNIPYQLDLDNGRLICEEIEINYRRNQDTEEHLPAQNPERRIVVIWEDQYAIQAEIIHSRIRSLFGINKRIYGRETMVAPISQPVLDDFLTRNHLNGTTKARHRYGLVLKDELVAVIGFGRSCPIDFEGRTYRSHELIRFCSKQGFTVVGGLSKLIQYFIKQHKPEHLMTSIDKEWSDGKSYEQLGFRLIEEQAPQQFLISPENGKRYRKTNLLNIMSRDEVNSLDWQKVSNLGNYKFIMIIT